MTRPFRFWVLIRRNPNTNLKRYLHPYVHDSIIHNNQDMEVTCVSIRGWTDEWEVVCTYNGTLLSQCKGGSLTTCDNVDGPREYHATVNKSEEDECHVTSLIHGIWRTNKQTNDTATDLQVQRTNWWLPGGRQGEGLGQKQLGTGSYKTVTGTWSTAQGWRPVTSW